MANSYSLRDSFQSRVYRAENKAFEGIFGEEPARFASFGELERWVENLVKSDWFKKHYPHVKRIDVHKRASSFGACGNFDPLWGKGFIKMPDSPWGRRKWLVCHELGHAVTPLHKYVGGKRVAVASGHGREWRVNYIKLVQHALGEDAAKRLKQAFKDAKLKTGVKRTRVLTPEQKAALVERLAKAREARTARASLAVSNGIAAMLGMARTSPLVRQIRGNRVYLAPKRTICQGENGFVQLKRKGETNE